MVFSLIDIYLKKNPAAKRPQEELDELDGLNNFKQDRVILPTNDNDSSEEEIKVVQKPKPKKFAPQKNICAQCPKMVEGYKCIPGQNHLKCSNCNGFMPDRFPNQKCAICTRGFCNLY